MRQIIYETAVYCGRLKEWRILNITTGTVYSDKFDNEEDALSDIEHGKMRSGAIVKRISLGDLRYHLKDRESGVGH